MTETTEATTAPKLSDVQKQRKHVDGLRRVQTKVVRRGMRPRLQAMEKTFVQLLMELRQALQFLKDKTEEHDTVQQIIAKSLTGQEISQEDMDILTELATTKEPDAGSGPEAAE